MASTLEEGHLALDAAGERQQKIDGLIAEQQAILKALEEERARKGRGRPSTAHAAKKTAAESKIARLQRNLLPGEFETPTMRAAADLRGSRGYFTGFRKRSRQANQPKGKMGL